MGRNSRKLPGEVLVGGRWDWRGALTWPAVVEGDWDGVFALGEKSDEVDVEFEAIVVFDWESEVGEGVDVVFCLSPVVAKWLACWCESASNRETIEWCLVRYSSCCRWKTSHIKVLQCMHFDGLTSHSSSPSVSSH